MVAESYKLWLQFDVRTDDITMILAFVEFGRAKKAAVAAGPQGRSRGSIRGSISLGADMLKGVSVRAQWLEAAAAAVPPEQPAEQLAEQVLANS